MRATADATWLRSVVARDRYCDGVATLEITADGSITADRSATLPSTPHVVDVGRLHALATLLRGITDTTRVHAINTPLLASADS